MAASKTQTVKLDIKIASMVAMRNEGKTLQQVANAYDLSRERVRQLLKRVNYVGHPANPPIRATNEQKAMRKQRHHVYIKKWQQENRSKVNKWHADYVSKRHHSDINFRMRKNLHSCVRRAIANANSSKSAKTMDLIGCTFAELRAHLESHFAEGMSWDNWGLKGWHIDHIRPCASFDLSDPEQQRQCFHWSNLQPLWAMENIRKAARWENTA
jgi:hypothetical protein